MNEDSFNLQYVNELHSKLRPLQPKFHTKWFMKIMQMVENPKLGIEYGVHTGGTFALLSYFVETSIGIDNYIDMDEAEATAFIKQHVEPRMKHIKTISSTLVDYKVVIEDGKTSKTIDDLPNGSVDLLHYDAVAFGVIADKITANFRNKLSSKSIVCFDNFEIEKFDYMLNLLRVWFNDDSINPLYPFCVTSSVNNQSKSHGKIYLAENVEYQKYYYGCLQSLGITVHENCIWIDQNKRNMTNKTRKERTVEFRADWMRTALPSE